MGTTLHAMIEVWCEEIKSQLDGSIVSIAHWEDFIEWQFNKKYDLMNEISKIQQPLPEPLFFDYTNDIGFEVGWSTYDDLAHIDIQSWLFEAMLATLRSLQDSNKKVRVVFWRC